MLVDSHLLQELDQNAFSPTGQPMCVYGDPANPPRVHSKHHSVGVFLF